MLQSCSPWYQSTPLSEVATCGWALLRQSSPPRVLPDEPEYRHLAPAPGGIHSLAADEPTATLISPIGGGVRPARRSCSLSAAAKWKHTALNAPSGVARPAHAGSAAERSQPTVRFAVASCAESQRAALSPSLLQLHECCFDAVARVGGLQLVSSR